jgi:hypothetical protein
MSARNTKILLGVLLALFLLSTVTLLVVVFLVSRPDATVPAFADLRERDIPGRYKMNDGPKEMFIVLYDDHTFMNEDGTSYPQYQWELAPDGFALTWQRNTTHFTNIEARGIYTGAKENGAPLRLEKLPPYTPAQLAPVPPIATIRFGAQCETNGLIPVHNTPDADGEILPGDFEGVDCFRLVRKPGKGDAYLYLQIAPALKDPPFTNAFVIVEFFDRASAGGRPGRLLVHYDDERGGAYAQSQPLPMRGSEAWGEATFYLATPLFQGRQNGGADLRLVVSRSELPIRSVKLVKNVPIPEIKMPAVTRR